MNDRGFDQGRRDNGSQLGTGRREERDIEHDMQRERTMQGGQGRGWNESRDDERHMSERQGYGRDERQSYGRDERQGYGREQHAGDYDREHDLRRHKFGFGGTDGGFQGGGYGNQGYGNQDWQNRGYSNPGFQGGYGNQGGYGAGQQDRGYGNPGFQGGGYGNQGGYGAGQHDRGYGNQGFQGGGYGNQGFQGGGFGNQGGGFGNESRGGYGAQGGGMGNQPGGMNRDEQQRRGRAPKSYQRSDERVKEDICDRLMHSHIDAENVDVQVRSGEVTLTGTVEHRSAKRDIEDLAEQILGVREVQNQIRVQRHDEQQAQSHATTSGTTTASKKPTA